MVHIPVLVRKALFTGMRNPDTGTINKIKIAACGI